MRGAKVKGWTKILLLHAEDIEGVGASHCSNFLFKRSNRCDSPPLCDARGSRLPQGHEWWAVPGPVR